MTAIKQLTGDTRWTRHVLTETETTRQCPRCGAQPGARCRKPCGAQRAAHMDRRTVTFPGRGTVIKPARDRDLYVSWSNIAEAPHGVWTRAEALADGCPPDRLERADASGSSSHVPEGKPFYGWDTRDLIAEQRGLLPRARLADYAIAYCENRMEDCWDMLEPFDDDTPVRRG